MRHTGKGLVARIGSEIDRKGLKRSDLYSIVPSGTLSNWKNKGQEPSAYTLYKVAVFLGVSMDWLLTGHEPTGLTQDESDLLLKYRILGPKDKTEIIGLINIKIENAKKGDISSNSETA
jgi:transcriptional regulator with XRE-family HTH domain